MPHKFNGGTVEEQRIKVLIIQYEDSIRYKKKLLDCYLAEALLSVIPICMKNQKTLETRLEEKAKECKRLKLSLESAQGRIAKFCTEYSENSAMKEFLDFAVFLSTFRDSNEDIGFTSKTEKERLFQYFGISLDIYSYYDNELNGDEQELNGGSSIFPLNVINEDLLTLNSKLELAQESLNAEKLQSKQLKYERDSLDNLSDKLCYLLFEYQKRINTPAEKKETKSQTLQDSDHPNTEAVYDSSLFTERNTLQSDELTLVPSQNLPENHSPRKDIDAASILSKTSEQKPGDLDQILVDLSDVLIQDQLPELPNDDHILGDYVVLIFQDQSLEIPNKVSQEILGTENKPEHDPEDVSENESEINIQEKGQHVADERVRNPICETRLVNNEKKIEKNNESSNVGDISRETIKTDVSNVCSGMCNEICLRKHLQRHIRPIHNKETRYQCSVCAKKFTDSGNYKQHILVHSEKPFKCLVCNRKFRNLSAKDNHQQTVHIHKKDARYQCAHCDRRYSRKSNLAHHIYLCHFPEAPKEFECTICDKSFVYESFLKTHQLQHKSQKPSKRSITIDHDPHSNQVSQNSSMDIEQSLTSNNALPSSTIVSLEVNCPPYHCEKCDKSYPGEKDGRKLVKCPVCDAPEHYKSDGVSGKYCNICNRSFTRRHNLKRHISVVHNKVKPFECSQCGKFFSRESELKSHAIAHETQKSFKCSICHQRFKHLSHQQRHVEIFHKKTGLIQCAHCDKQYGYKSGLIYHIRTQHFSVLQKDFKCTLCDKRFSLKSSLKTHQLAHSSDKPVKCSICDKKFKTNHYKRRHEWSVHRKGDRFHCAHCENVYSVKNNLVNHLQNHHADLFRS